MVLDWLHLAKCFLLTYLTQCRIRCQLRLQSSEGLTGMNGQDGIFTWVFYAVGWVVSRDSLPELVHVASCATHEFVFSQLQISPSLPHFGIPQLDPVNSSPLLGFS